MKNKIFPGILLPLALATAAQANTETDTYNMDPVIVTASRTAQTVDQALAPVTVITEQDIAQQQPNSVQELLTKIPGVQISNTGGEGASTSIFIRGTSSSNNIVMIDGVRVGSATLGTTDIQYLDPDQIERIEIVRGPRSSLYGADAVGGVISIFTKQGKGAPKATFSVTGGTQKTSGVSAGISGSSENTSYRLSTRYYNTVSGSRVKSSSNSSDNDKDVFRNKTVSASVSHEFDTDLKLSGQFLSNQGKNDIDLSSDKSQEFNNQVFSLSGTKKVNDSWTTKLLWGRSDDKNTQIPSKGTFETTRHSASWQNDIALNNNNLLTAGIDFLKDQVESSTTNYKEKSRKNTGVFVQNQSRFGKHDMQVSLRRDDNQRYGENTTGGISYGYQLDSNLKLLASYSTAFRAPTFNELYFPGYGDPKNKPEKSRNFEVGARMKFGTSSVDVNLFQNKIEDLLAGNPIKNVDKADIKGIEVIAATKLGEWNLNTNLTLLDPVEKRKGEKDRQLTRRSRQTLNMRVDRTIEKVTFGANWELRSGFKEYNFDGSKTVEASGYGLVGLDVTYKVNSEIKTGLKVVNVFDKDYTTALNLFKKTEYVGQARGAFATITWTPSI